MLCQLRHRVAAVLGVTVLLSAGSVWAQNQPNPPQQPQVRQPQQPQQPQQVQQQIQQRQPQAGQRFSAVPQGAQQAAHNDAQLAAWLIVDNQNEVVLAKMGQERAKNDDIKELSQKMRDDHQQFLSKLQPFAATMAAHQQGAVNNNQNSEQRREGNEANTAREPQANNQNNAQNRPVENATGQQVAHQGQMAHGINFVALKREMGAQCLQSAEKELGQKSGAEFDECYLGMQIGMHHMAVDTMTVFRGHASPALQQVLDQGIETAQGHLKHAKELMKERKEKDTKTSQRNTNLK